jgi:hypothetical protein
VDALSEVLRVVKLDSAIFFNAEFSEPWCLCSPEARAIAPVLAPRAGHVIVYHLLCEGRAYARLEDGEPVGLQAGDLVTFPHGHSHLLGNGRTSTTIDGGAALPAILANGLRAMRMGGGGQASCFICGFLRLRMGARSLTSTSWGVAEIAAGAGYESEAAFNRAFKREYGVPPARYRQTQKAARESH